VLEEETGLPRLPGVKRNLLANLFQQSVGGGIENNEGLNCNWLEKITAL